jgi:hypothetical protein
MVEDLISTILKSKLAWFWALYYSPVMYVQLTSGIARFHEDFEQSSFHPYRMARVWLAIFHLLGQYPYLSAFKKSARFRRSCTRYENLVDIRKLNPYPNGAPKCLLNLKYGRRSNICELYLPTDYSLEDKVDFVVVNFYGYAWTKWSDARKYTAAIAMWALENSRCAVIIPEYGGSEPFENMRQDFYAILGYAADIANECCSTPRIRVISHSAGAQIFSTILIKHLTGEKICYPMKLVDRVAFMAGVYNIPAHYMYESKRGVEGISMMYRAFNGQEGMRKESMVLALQKGKQFMTNVITPKILVAHGDIDRVVPVSQSWEFFRELQKMSLSVQFYMARSADHLLPFHLFATSDRWRCDPYWNMVMSEFLLSPIELLSRL